MTFAFARRTAFEPPLMLSAAVLSAGLLALYLFAGATDPRLLDGVPVWAKPTKFALALTIHFATLAWIESRMTAEELEKPILWLARVAMVTAFLAEMAYITAQAGQAEHSHFNLSTPYHAFMYQTVMAVGAVVLVLGPLAFAWVALRAEGLGAGLRSGIVWGGLLSFALTMIVAGYMSSSGGHLVGIPTEGTTLPGFGWSMEVGDLRPAHFLSLHALQIFPALGWFLDRRGTEAPLRWMRATAGLYATATLAVFVQALAGLPLIAL